MRRVLAILVMLAENEIGSFTLVSHNYQLMKEDLLSKGESHNA